MRFQRRFQYRLGFGRLLANQVLLIIIKETFSFNLIATISFIDPISVAWFGQCIKQINWFCFKFIFTIQFIVAISDVLIKGLVKVVYLMIQSCSLKKLILSFNFCCCNFSGVLVKVLFEKRICLSHLVNLKFAAFSCDFVAAVFTIDAISAVFLKVAC